MSDGLDDRNQEKLVTKDDFINRIKRAYDYDELITSLAFAGEEIRGKQKKSNMATVAFFLEFWPEEAEGFARIISKRYGAKELITELSNRCLDPSHITKDVINNCHNLILMSGTLTPTFMYKDILGFDDAKEVEFKNPFPEKNRLSLIIPETSTKYARRNKDEYQKIAAKIEEITDNIPGNVIVFFPSYFLRNNVYAFMDKNKKRILLEKSGMTKEEKNDMLDQFKGHKDDGAILMAATAGSFGEGVDLPGDYLKGVIIVGLPLEKPTLEIKELISYYDRKFSRGWEYGYVYPAIIKVLQNAGRCIRSENDKGVIVFLDERYSWDSYYKCFPLDYNVKISKLYEKKIKEFFT
ncbi:MAG: ATP-dependent DNA helicase [Nanoarchaeota archaeon]